MNRTLHDALLARERRLLDPSVRANRTAVAALLAEEFREVGRSGRTYDRDAILDLLGSEIAQTVEIEQFVVTSLGLDSALASYVSHSRGARARRSSVWVFRESRWQMLYHQGTPVGDR